MRSISTVGITQVENITDKNSIKKSLFYILDQVKQRANIQIPPEARIMIKVNLCTVKGYETGATVDPYVAHCLAEWLIQEFNPKIIYIGEADATELNADIAFQALGWRSEFSREPKIQLINLAKDDCRTIHLKNGLLFKELEMSKKYMESDFLISLAKLKTNSLNSITCILKNQFGITPVKQKSKYHKKLNEAIYDLNLLKLPDLNIVDGLIAMEGEGPIMGIPKPLGLFIVGNDPVATDHACARIMKIPIRTIPSLGLAIRKKLGNSSYQVVGKSIKEVQCKFIRASAIKRTIAAVLNSDIFNNIKNIAKSRNIKSDSSLNQKKMIGIVGLGAISELRHLPILKSMDNVEIVAACERDKSRLERRQAKWKIPRVFDDYNSMLESTKLDAVFICLPTSLHYDAVKSALAHNIHVFCEKPLGLSYEKAKELVTCAQSKNLELTVGYSRMLNEGYRKAEKTIKSLRLGNIIQINANLVSEGPYFGWMPRSDWFFNADEGGALYDFGSHLFSIITYILNDRISEVSASTIYDDNLPGIYTRISGWFRTKKEILGTFNIGWKSAVESNTIEILGTAGQLIIDQYGCEERYGDWWVLKKLLNSINSTLNMFRIQIGQRLGLNTANNAFYIENSAFLSAIDGKGKSIISTDDALHILAILDAITKSIKTGKKITINS